MSKDIWVLPEINSGGEVSKLSLGLLSEAWSIATKVGGVVTALVLSDQNEDCSEVFAQYCVTRAYIFRDPLFKDSSAEAYAAALLPRLQADKPWLFLMGHTTTGRELGPRLAALLKTGLVSNCVKIDLSTPENLKFFRPVYGDQLFQEVVFQRDGTMLVTMNPKALNVTPAAEKTQVIMQVIEPEIPADLIRTRHLEYLSADFQAMDIAEAETIVAAGMGAATDELLPLVEELAALFEGTIGTTRPVVDEGKIPRERMIGQTGKVVSPDLYLALGVSGATHHVGGIQESGKIVSINRDLRAPIFQHSDTGVIADLHEVLPKLIERIKRAKENGEIL